MRNRPHREIRHDDGDVARTRDHGVGPIGLAPARHAAMRVQVSYHLQTGLAASRPELSEGTAVQDANAGPVCARISGLLAS